MTGRVLHKTPTPDDGVPIRTRHKQFTQLPGWQDAALTQLAYAKGISVSEAIRLCVTWGWRRLERMKPRQVPPLRRPQRRRVRDTLGDRRNGHEGSRDAGGQEE